MKRGAQKGNRNRAKDKLLEAAFRRELTQNPEHALAIAQACIARASKGDISAAQFIRDTVDGKPTEHLEVEGSVDHLMYADFLSSKLRDPRAAADETDTEQEVR